MGSNMRKLIGDKRRLKYHDQLLFGFQQLKVTVKAY